MYKKWGFRFLVVLIMIQLLLLYFISQSVITNHYFAIFSVQFALITINYLIFIAGFFCIFMSFIKKEKKDTRLWISTVCYLVLIILLVIVP